MGTTVLCTPIATVEHCIISRKEPGWCLHFISESREEGFGPQGAPVAAPRDQAGSRLSTWSRSRAMQCPPPACGDLHVPRTINVRTGSLAVAYCMTSSFVEYTRMLARGVFRQPHLDHRLARDDAQRSGQVQRYPKRRRHPPTLAVSRPGDAQRCAAAAGPATCAAYAGRLLAGLVNARSSMLLRALG